MKSVEKPKIYFLMLHLRTGGIEIITANLANAFVRKGYHVSIISLIHDDEILDLLDHNINIEYLGDLKQYNTIWFKLYWRILLLKLQYRLKKIHQSIIISTRDEYNTIVSRSVSDDNIKVAWLHHDYIGHKKLINDFKYKYGNIDKFILLTKDIEQEISELMIDTNKRTTLMTIPNFLPNKSLHLSVRDKEYLQKLQSNKYCIAIGRLSKEKGFDRLIDIWQIVIKHTKDDLKLYIVGDGPEREQLQMKINVFGLSEYITLLGRQSNDFAQRLSSKAIAYCMTSHTEAFPLVLLEALNVGTPQIAFDVRVGPRNIIIDGKTGFLIENGDNSKFAEKVVELYNNPELRNGLIENSKHHALNYSEDSIVSEWERKVLSNDIQN